MFTAMAGKQNPQNDGIHIDVTFSDGPISIVEPFVLRSAADFTGFAERLDMRCKALDALYTESAKFTPGPVTFQKAADPDPETVAKELARNTFFRDLAKLDRMSMLLRLELITSGNDDYEKLRSDVVAQYKPEYFA